MSEVPRIAGIRTLALAFTLLPGVSNRKGSRLWGLAVEA